MSSKTLLSFKYNDDGYAVMPLARLWLARAHVANGGLDAARESYEEFLEWMNAGAGIPVIAEARKEYAALLEVTSWHMAAGPYTRRECRSSPGPTGRIDRNETDQRSPAPP